MAERKKKMGRPTKYTAGLCRQLPEMFAGGESVAEVCAELRISKDTFYEWVKLYPNFSDAYQKGLGLSEAWWTKLGRAGAAGARKIQPATWIFNMKNRFGWRERIEQEQNVRIGGVLAIPESSDSEEDWEAIATRQQDILRRPGE